MITLLRPVEASVTTRRAMFALFFVAAAMAQNVASKKEREACPFWVSVAF